MGALRTALKRNGLRVGGRSCFLGCTRACLTGVVTGFHNRVTTKAAAIVYGTGARCPIIWVELC